MQRNDEKSRRLWVCIQNREGGCGILRVPLRHSVEGGGTHIKIFNLWSSHPSSTVCRSNKQKHFVVLRSVFVCISMRTNVETKESGREHFLDIIYACTCIYVYKSYPQLLMIYIVCVCTVSDN